jgi:nitroimidazol reductase NimA-like FMN-containing flavoprotein (pyridoxamine 5'-phosphate oxidase superfamily)
MIKDLEHKEELQLLSDNYIGHLAFIASGSPHVLPITYFYDSRHRRIISYASEGHKIEAMRKNKLVALAVDEIDSVNKWQSILVHGEFAEVRGPDARFELRQFTEGVKEVIARKEKKQLQFISEFSSKLESEGSPIVYHIKITGITGKSRDS